MIGVLSCAACVHEVRPEAPVLSAARAVLPLKVKYWVPPGEVERSERGRYFNLGIAHAWRVKIGEVVTETFPRMLGTVFAEVTSASRADDVEGADVLVSPVLTAYEVDEASFVATMKMRVTVLAPDRHVMLEEVISVGPDETEETIESMGGVFTADRTLRHSAERALKVLMNKTAERLTQEFKPRATQRKEATCVSPCLVSAS
jgi:hypothetical protein